MEPLLHPTPRGLYCPAGDFYIDPERRVQRAIITHAHTDHARPGMAHYLCTPETEVLLRARFGTRARKYTFQALRYGYRLKIRGVWVSLHPAGHILGSAMVRITDGRQLWLVTGDYKMQPDPTCADWDPPRADVLVTETTFAQPYFNWDSPAAQQQTLLHWAQRLQRQQRTGILYSHPLGKPQRLLALLAPHLPVYVDRGIDHLNQAYHAAGMPLPPYRSVDSLTFEADLRGAVVLAGYGQEHEQWRTYTHRPQVAMASGWMQLRQRRHALKEGYGIALSDHADWQGILATIAATGASTVYTTHGDDTTLLRYLAHTGHTAAPLKSLGIASQETTT